MPNLKQYFNGGANADDDFELIGEGQHLGLKNARYGTTDKGKTGNIESILGTEEIPNPYLPTEGVNVGNGGCEDAENNRIIKLIKNSQGNHGIYCYDKAADTLYKVLLDEQVSGGLNFSNYIHSCRVVDGKLLITDDDNEPSYINIDAGIKLNHSDFDTDEEAYTTPVKIKLIKRPPIYRLQMTKASDAGFDNNFIKDNALQFCYRYQYKDDQNSVLSVYSQVSPYNGVSEANNCIDLYLPFTEQIPDYARQVDICVLDLDTLAVKVVKKYSKDDSDDLAAIALHNAGTTQLGFRFYGNEGTETVDDITKVTHDDDVPLQAATVEVAKNRVIFGYCKSGYDTPKKTSLAVTLTDTDTGATGDFDGTWKYVTLHANYTSTGIQDTFNFPYVEKNSDPTKVYFFPSVRNSSIWNGGVGTVPASISLSLATFSNDSLDNLVAYLKGAYYPTGGGVGTPPWDAGYDLGYIIGADSGAVTVLEFQPVSVTQFFKSDSAYEVTIAFFDEERRRCGVVKKTVKANIPTRTYSQSAFTTLIAWTLSNTDAVNEIPDWAFYYQIHISKNTTRSFFVQSRSYGVKYVIKNEDGTYDYTSTTPATNVFAVAIDLQTLTNYGLGYTYTKGDRINIHVDTVTNYSSLVTGQDGNYVFAQLVDLGTLTGSELVLFELYTPYKQQTSTGYYEAGDMMDVSNPGTAERSYSTLTGQLNGDTFAVERLDKNGDAYIVEAMSPNDTTWQNWHTDTGWENFVDELGQQIHKQQRRFSDVLLPGTKVNGLNKFQPLNRDNVDADGGSIKRLLLVNKIQQAGTVLLSICSNETFSTYLGEQEVFDAKGSSYIAKSDSFLGTTKPLQGSKGTNHPASAFIYNGLAIWYDQRNSCVVQYSVNGLDAISNNKLVRVAHLLGQDLEDGQLIIGGIDPYHKEFLFSIPKTQDTPPKGYLEDYDQLAYPYDIYDGKAKTLVYKSKADWWIGEFEHTAETYIRLGDELYSLFEGRLYKHNVDTGTIYGKPYTSKIAFSANAVPGNPVTFKNIALHSNVAPSFVHMRTEDPFIQSSDLIAEDFTAKEGIQKAAFFRNRLDPNVEGEYNIKLISGEKLYGKFLLVMLEFDQPVSLKFSDIEYTINAGNS